MTQTTHTVLDNGLTVYLKENHSAPIVSQWVWYRVGSRNETPGKTGISHWCEHMQFKGTPRFPAGALDKAISRTGGTWNAFTSMDFTAFFETLPADALDLAIDLESDRMINSQYLPEEVESERTVVISELDGGENEPMTRLSKAMNRAAFARHPYGNEVIGTREDLRGITRDELYNYYRTHYLPNNAVLAIAGDFDTQEVLKKVSEKYGQIRPGTIPACAVLPEGEIPESKTIRETGERNVPILKLAWRAPQGNSPDIYALHIFDSILSGAEPFGVFGNNSLSGRTSRLYRALVQNGYASNFGGGYMTTIDPYLYTQTAFSAAGKAPEEVMAVIDAEIADIARNAVTEEEIRKAVKQAKALMAYSDENIANQAYWLGYASMFASPEWYDGFIAEIEKVTPDDVRRIAQTYFRPDHRIIGIYEVQEAL